MYGKNKILFILSIILLFCLFGCPEKNTAEIPALVVVDTIPERVNKDIFEKEIRNHKELKNNKKSLDLLAKAYVLDDTTGEYALEQDQKKANEQALLGIFRAISYIPLFSESNGKELITSLAEWTEIICTTPRDTPKSVKSLDGAGNEITEEWFKIKAGAREGWIQSPYLLFKSFKETEAVVIKVFSLFQTPDYGGTFIRRCNRGLTVTLSGYEYLERKEGKNQLAHLKIYDDYGWGYYPHILAEAHIGVILPDEVSLYSAPDDIKENVEKGKVYTKLEIVPILDLLENGWYKVVYEGKDDSLYIKDGNEKVSSKKDDITFSSWIRDDYNEGMKLLDLIFSAKETDPVQGVAGITEKQAKLKRLEEIYENIEDKKAEYPESVFAGIGPYSLREFLQNIMIAQADLERVISSSGDTIDDEEDNIIMAEPDYDNTTGGM